MNGTIYRPSADWSGRTDKNNLLKIRAIKPELGDELLVYLHSLNTGGMALDTYLKKYLDDKVIYTDNDDVVTATIFGMVKGNTRLISYEAHDRNRVGLNKAEFKLVFADPLFSEVHDIVGMNDRYKVKVMSDAKQEGTGYAYICTVMGGNDNYIPASELTAGTLWSRDGASVPMTRSRKGAKASYTSPYKRSYNWSSTRTENEAGGDMAKRPIAAFTLVDDKGKSFNYWEDYDTWVNDLHFKELRNKTLMFGRDNQNAQGGYDDIDRHSGEEIVTGSGLMEQMERANLNYFNQFDIDEFSSLLMRLNRGKKNTDKIHYLVSTGREGLMAAHNAITEKARGWTLVDNKAIFGERESLGYGNSFRRYYHPSGFTVDFRLEPMFDDDSRTPVRHPVRGYARSYEYHIMDLGETSGESNVELRYVGNARDINVIQPGLRDPYTGNLNEAHRVVVSAVDGWVEHRMSQFMVIIKNPLNTLIYRPDSLR